MKNLRKYKDIKLVTTEKRTNYLVSDPNQHNSKFFTEDLLPMEIKKKQRYFWVNLFI